jgi:fucose 4-O-acetylase-like acetyltransferase
MDQAVTGRKPLSWLWRVPLIAIGLLFLFLPVVSLVEHPSRYLGWVAMFLATGGLCVVAGLVKSGSKYQQYVVIAAIFAIFIVLSIVLSGLQALGD